jgi:hypothetical protein
MFIRICQIFKLLVCFKVDGDNFILKCEKKIEKSSFQGGFLTGQSLMGSLISERARYLVCWQWQTNDSSLEDNSDLDS